MKTHIFQILTGICFLVTSKSVFAINKPSLSFEENKGQVHDQYYKPRTDILFSGTDGQMGYYFKKSGISYQISKVISLKNEKTNTIPNGIIQNFKVKEFQFDEQISIYRVDIKWLNCNLNSFVNKGEALESYNNYYLTSCPNGALEVKSYSDITYQNLYQGINLKYYVKNGILKYDYEVAAGADYTNIKFEIKGANNILVNNKGQLIIHTPYGQIVEEAPLVLQDGKILKSNWQINNEVVSFQIKDVDVLKGFTIDPLVHLWGTYYGGSGNDWTGTIYTDANANLYVCGGTTSSNLNSMATIGAHQTTFGGGSGGGVNSGDSYLVKFNSSGQRLWGTYYGGTGNDYAACCVVDAIGDVYISGGTSSSNPSVMATPGSHQSTYAGGSGTFAGDAFLAKFNGSGFRYWSTYFGGIGADWANGIACDNQNNIYFTGYTSTNTSTTIASPGCHQSSFGLSSDAFLAKFNSSGTRLWSTYYGGIGGDVAYGCITDASGNVFIGGITASSNSISTTGSHQANYGGGIGNSLYGVGDAFLVKFNAAGVRQWGTYYGGTGDEFIYYCATDASGNVYFTGWTSTPTSTAIATLGSYQNNYGGGAEDAMIVKFNTQGVRQWGSYFGGVGNEDFCCCFTDQQNGYVYISGITSTTLNSSIVTSCTYQDVFAGGTSDAFLAKFDLKGSRIWSTYFGDIGNENWSCVAIDIQGSVYLAGDISTPSSTIIAPSGAHQSIYGGGSDDSFIEKFNACIPTMPAPILNSVACKGQSAILISQQSCGLKWYSDSTLINPIYSGGNFTTNPISNDTTFYYVDVSCGQASTKAIAHVSVVAGPSVHITASNTLVCKGETATLVPVGANYYSWVGSSNPYTLSVSPNVITVYTVTGTLFNGGCPGSAYISIGVSECVGLNENSLPAQSLINIYPNPNNGSFIISSNKQTDLMIVNQLGQNIRKIELNEANGFQVVINDLPNGLYYVSCKSNNFSNMNKIIVFK